MLVARRNLASLCVQGTRAAAIGAMQSRNISIRGADNSRWGRTRENWDSVLDRFAKVRSSSCCLLYPRGAMFCKQDTCGDGALSLQIHCRKNATDDACITSWTDGTKCNLSWAVGSARPGSYLSYVQSEPEQPITIVHQHVSSMCVCVWVRPHVRKIDFLELPSLPIDYP